MDFDLRMLSDSVPPDHVSGYLATLDEMSTLLWKNIVIPERFRESYPSGPAGLYTWSSYGSICWPMVAAGLAGVALAGWICWRLRRWNPRRAHPEHGRRATRIFFTILAVVLGFIHCVIIPFLCWEGLDAFFQFDRGTAQLIPIIASGTSEAFAVWSSRLSYVFAFAAMFPVALWGAVLLFLRRTSAPLVLFIFYVALSLIHI